MQTLADAQSSTHVKVTSVSAVQSKDQPNAGTQAASTIVNLPNLQFKVQVVGTSGEIENFMGSLESATRLIAVTDATLQAGSGGQVQATMDIAAYYSPSHSYPSQLG
ncbi:hypothetical protein [Alicyclobacillus dauci]|uniref:Uncharacterized protein n=1 Tax=Alicyclobacillus dauci TaxID=1475485 RepID=A0ABY6Z1M0_9BACL|nr:hypothetical protein [Alicyclobacillus dauci]WAH36737.1 hypothetical protein NZD86_21605 [Alicyclobacillus dauci]